MRSNQNQARDLVKIVFVIDSLSRHGTQRFLLHLVRGLHLLGYEQIVVVLNDVCDPEIEKGLATAGCRLLRIGKPALLAAGYGWWRLVSILRHLQADLVVTMLDFADTLGRPAARLAGCPVLVSSIRVRNLSKPSWRGWMDRKTIRWCQKVVFNSHHVAEYSRLKEGAKVEQIVVIPNGVEDLRAGRDQWREGFRKRLEMLQETKLIGAVARLHPQKNLSLFLRSLAQLSTDRPWKAVVLGEGPARQALLAESRALGLTDRVTWLGARSDVEGWLAAMDLFVHTADFEGMPNALMEAMAAGLPVIAASVDGVRELIDDASNGYLVPSRDAAGFAKRIKEVMEDPELGARLGREAHRAMRDRFGIGRMIVEYDNLFRSLVKREG
jgi:glycosyltransferase involved in cell wall biosynthesis